MNQVIQGESSGGPSGLPLKRRRGRPRKNPSLKQAKAVNNPPGFEGLRESHPQGTNSTQGIDFMVGQAVTGVIEATFDAGYLLNVRIGNSSMRGVIFKPGQLVPVTPENDVAPHAQMIRRNIVQLPTENQNRSIAPLKRKASESVPSQLGGRSVTVEHVVLESVNTPNGPNSNDMSLNAVQTGHVLDFGDKKVHMAEPISVLPPAPVMLPAGQIFAGAQQSSVNQQVAEDGKENINGSVNESIFLTGQDDKTNPMAPTESDTSGSLESSDTEAMKSPEDSRTVLQQETEKINEPFSVDSLQTATIATPPLFGYGSGRMTELLQAVQENIKDPQAQLAEQRRMNETYTDNEAKGP